uniref:Nuclear transcription factor Y, beta b n=1 Tax=Oryzias sinensis TaxID=183150 RepID=A0A8C7YUG0_9TELE
MDGDSSTTDTSQLGITGEYMASGQYVLQPQDDGEESMNDHEEGGSKENYREQDIYLPIANVARIMKNAVPQTGKVVGWLTCSQRLLLLTETAYWLQAFLTPTHLLSPLYTTDRQRCQRVRAGVCERVHQLHHIRGE